MLSFSFCLNAPLRVKADELIDPSDFTYEYKSWQGGGYYTVFTPNQTPVTVFNYYDIYEYLDFEKNAIREEITELFPNAEYISEATINYNCHSYAWYSQNTSTNEYWMNDPSGYYSDKSYIEVDTPIVGDIICYFTDNGTIDISDDINIHSGIVVQVFNGSSNNICGNANLVQVESKWGSYPLYRHRGDQCPYVYNTSIILDDYAEYVKFYRRHINHSYTNTYENLDNSQHRAYCACGEYVTTNHNYSYSYLDKHNHKTSCLNCEYQTNESHVINSSGFCTVCLQHINHNWSYSYLNNNLHSRSCTICVYAETSPHVFDADNLTYCIACEHIVLGGGIGGIGGVFSIELAPLVSVNGSYVLSNGCVVLVEEDKEAYFNDTLQFYPRGEVPQIS